METHSAFRIKGDFSGSGEKNFQVRLQVGIGDRIFFANIKKDRPKIEETCSWGDEPVELRGREPKRTPFSVGRCSSPFDIMVGKDPFMGAEDSPVEKRNF